eukprot:gnl/TRDRNA2_/TRDRNA2_28118_c0_seq1.p1 gnl/TRDRNA2_/TRDRNA2_28118_c0~~gnl/TRDRNA2_/TRDRNA2_28118_c0_seq1.p1  ORF type:complete len:171 (+),score=5.38 gnl/TRDRNA2_/TRDRNA2_28118_c0_seq1:64-576(+)
MPMRRLVLAWTGFCNTVKPNARMSNAGSLTGSRRHFCGMATTGSGSSLQAKVPLLNTFTFYKRLADTNIALVCFTTLGCGSCHSFKLLLPSLQDRVDQKRKAGYGMDLTVFEVDAGDSPGLANELEVIDLPALFLYVNGEYHAPIQAPPEVDLLYMAIVRATKEPAQEPP